MHEYLARNASVDDIRATYLLLLGRAPESDAVIESRVGQPLIQAVTETLNSPEMDNLAARAIESGKLPHDRLTSVDRKRAATWVSRIEQLPSVMLSSDWWTLLDVLLGRDELRDVTAAFDIAEFRMLVMKRAASDAREFYSQRSFFTFDDDWFLRRNERARLALAGGIFPSPEAYFLAEGLREGEQLLPAFSIGTKDSYARALEAGDLTIENMLSQLFLDAREDKLSHWLFNHAFYRDGPQWQAGSEIARRDNAGTYLDFLVYGDACGYSPHPLFSSFAYEALNKGNIFKFGPSFQDYITEGCFLQRKTSAIFDDEYYTLSNPDVPLSLLKGTHVSALHHFLTVGLIKDLPFSPDFDISYYLDRNPDVAQAIRDGSLPSASYHFLFHGLGKGRAPNPFFDPHYYRQRYPDAGSEMQKLGIRSELEHFLLIGKSRGYKPGAPLVNERPAMDAAKAIFQRRARRSFDSLSRARRDFGPFAASPSISVIVPVFNEIEFTAHFLQCAYFAAACFKQATGLDCEIVVVDNGSEDGTDALIASCPGLVAVHFDDPIGFPRAVNAGVQRARGEILIVANNDIEFLPDVFEKIYVRLIEDRAIGILGGLTILPNETLQEAGSFLNSSAGVIGLGRHEDPWNQYFHGVHTADYCTGSFIAFRREDYDAVGGFDEDFSPGYYEEVDFSFRLMEKLGKRAVVDSTIQVNHFEHASFGKGRPPTTAYALIRANQARFADKHRDAISRRPSPLALSSGQGARPLAIGRTRLLVIEDLMPDPRLGSGFVRSSQILAGLAKLGVPYDLLILNASPAVDDYVDQRVTVYRNWMPGEDFETVVTLKAGCYSHVMICRTHNLARFGAQLEVLRHQNGFKVICDTEALSILRVLESKRLAGRAVTGVDRESAVRLELNSSLAVAHWIAVSPYERDLMSNAGYGPISVICHRFTRRDEAAAHRPFGQRFRVLAVGAIHEAGSPNHDGLVWFMDRIYPRCRDALDGLALTVVGYWHQDIIEMFRSRYADAAIEFTGVVSEAKLTRLYGEARMALAPTRFAAGVASKILEPMMLGVPVVITDLLKQQLGGEEGTGLSSLAVGNRDDDGQSFSDWIRILASDQDVWQRVQMAQYEAADQLAGEKNFDLGIRSLAIATGMAPASFDTRPQDCP